MGVRLGWRGSRKPWREGWARQGMGKRTLEWISPFRCLHPQTRPALGQARVGGREGVSLASREPNPESPPPRPLQPRVRVHSRRGVGQEGPRRNSLTRFPRAGGSVYGTALARRQNLGRKQQVRSAEVEPCRSRRRRPCPVGRRHLPPARARPAHTCASSWPPGPLTVTRGVAPGSRAPSNGGRWAAAGLLGATGRARRPRGDTGVRPRVTLLTS